MGKAVHKLDSSTEDDARGGTYEYAWIACRDPERFNDSDDGRTYSHSYRWDEVTCKLCLRRRP